MRVAPLLVAPPTPPPPKRRSVAREPGGGGGGGGEPAVVKREGARSEEPLDHHCTSAAVSNCSHRRQLSTDPRLVSTCLTRPLLFNKLDQLRKSQKTKHGNVSEAQREILLVGGLTGAAAPGMQ